jgi:ABC-2 type transport system permease protein
MEHLHRILAIARKELKHITREPRILIGTLGLPIIQLLLFAYALSFDVQHVPTVVLDQDRTTASREYVSTLENSGFFHVVASLERLPDVDSAFLDGEARAAIVVAPGFGNDLSAGRRGQVAVLLDGSEPNSAQLGQAYANALSQVFGRQLAVARVEALGMGAAASAGIQASTRLWYNPDARSAFFLIPGLIVVIIMIVTVQQTATTLVREAEDGTLEQLLVSPVRRWELVLGKISPWALFAAADVVLISLIAVLVFGIPFRGSASLFALGSGLFVLCALAIGLVVSALAKSTGVANLTAMLVSLLPSFMLSGFVFPLANVPKLLQWISYLFPARYMVVIARSMFLKGAGWGVLWPQFAALAAYATIALTIASVAYRRKLR